MSFDVNGIQSACEAYAVDAEACAKAAAAIAIQRTTVEPTFAESIVPGDLQDRILRQVVINRRKSAVQQ